MTATQDTSRRGWLRRNIAPLLALVLIIPAITWVVYGIPHQEDLDRVTTSPVVPQGDAAEVGDYSLVLSNSKEFVGTGVDENKIPLGLALVAAIIDFTPGKGAGELGCTTTLVVPGRAGELSWPEVLNPADYGYGVGDDSDTNCYFDNETGSLEVVYLTPKGVYADAVIEVSVIGEPVPIRLALKR